MKKRIALLLAVCTLLGALSSCTSPPSNEPTPSHKHSFQSDWSTDDTHHWRDCKDAECTDVTDKDTHNWDNGTVIESGETRFTCAVCGKIKDEPVRTTATQKEWDAAFDLGTKWVVAATVSVPDHGSAAILLQARNESKFQFQFISLATDGGEIIEESYNAIIGSRWYDYTYDEGLETFERLESPDSVEENIDALMEDIFPSDIRDRQSYTYDEAKKAYVAPRIIVEDNPVLNNVELRFERGSLVAISYSLEQEGMTVQYDFTVTYAAPAVTLPSFVEKQIAYRVIMENSSDERVGGVEVQLFQKDDTPMLSLVTDENGVAFFYLDATERLSDYYFKITEVPEGYISQTVKYAFSDDSRFIELSIEKSATS